MIQPFALAAVFRIDDPWRLATCAMGVVFLMRFSKLGRRLIPRLLLPNARRS